MNRQISLERNTKETQIKLDLNLDGSGQIQVETGYGMLDHMLNLLAFWGGLDLNLKCQGDMHIDAHHSVEDVALALGSAIDQALGEQRKGIHRVGHGRVPMDEALCDVSLDLSGRAYLVWRGSELLPSVIANEEKDLWREFYKALATNSRANIHIDFLYGLNGHHLIESAAKGFGLALAEAVSYSQNINMVRSTKGGLI